MLTLYIICVVAGGGLVALSAFGGDLDGDVDADVGLDADIDADVDLGVDVDVEVDAGAGAGEAASGALTAAGDSTAIATVAGRDPLWLTLLSFRFWTFATAFFGLAGATLTFTTGLAGGMVAALAAGTGVTVGVAADRAIRFMRRRTVDSSIHTQALVGREATILLPVSRERTGKIRVSIGSREVEYLATTDEEMAFARGDTAVIIEFTEDRARVVHPSTLLARP